MLQSTAAKDKKENRKRFLEARTIFFLLALITLLTFLSFYSPHADAFSCRSSLFELFISGVISAGLLFGLGTGIAAYIWLPSLRTRRYHSSDSFKIDWEESQHHHYERHDWYNDATNPASPAYHAIHRPYDQD